MVSVNEVLTFMPACYSIDWLNLLKLFKIVIVEVDREACR